MGNEVKKKQQDKNKIGNETDKTETVKTKPKVKNKSGMRVLKKSKKIIRIHSFFRINLVHHILYISSICVTCK